MPPADGEIKGAEQEAYPWRISKILMGTEKFPSISIFLGEIRDSESPALLIPRHKIMEPFVYLLYFQLLVPSKVAENSHQGVFRLKKKLRVNRIYF